MLSLTENFTNKGKLEGPRRINTFNHKVSSSKIAVLPIPIENKIKLYDRCIF